MFDRVLVDGVEYQTKDAHNVLDTYEVREVDGQRRLYVETYELHPIPEHERGEGPLTPFFHREDTGWQWCDAANGVLALVGPDLEDGSLLLFVRDGVVVGERRVEHRLAEGGLCLGHHWPRAEELGVDVPGRDSPAG